MWNLCIVAFAITAAFSDVRWRKIPRALTVTGGVAGLIYQGFHDHLASTLLAALVAFVAGIALFALGAIGGGDVKLITALAAMLGFKSWAFAMEIAIFAAAGLAILQIMRHGAVRQTARNIVAIIKSLLTLGWRAHPDLNVNNPRLIRSPFGLAAAIGTVAAVFKP